MRIVQITTDSREHFRRYHEALPSFGTAPQALLEGFKYFPEAEIHVISCSHQKTVVPEKIADNIWFHQPVVGKLGWGKTLYSGCVKATRSLIKSIQPDIVHGQGTERECALSAVHSGFPNVVTIHGNMAELQRLGYHGNRVYGTIASFLENHTLSKTNGVFCNSKYTRHLVTPRSSKTWLVSNPIREVFFQPSTEGKATTTPRILNIGIISPRKRQLEILRALTQLKRDGHDFKIIFVGGMAEETAYEKAFAEEFRKAEQLGIAEYAGFLQAEGLVRLMDQSSGLIHFPAEEAFGLVVAESMARGLKMFGANHGGIRDIALDSPGAELHDSLLSLANGVVSWLKEGAPKFPDAATEMKKRYHPKFIAGQHLDIYREVLAK